MRNYLKGINQRVGNIFVNIRTLEELERKTKDFVDEDRNILEYNKDIKKVDTFVKNGEFDKAKETLEKLKKLHRMGYYELGKYYYFCEGDFSKAESNLYIAFENGIIKAGHYLGLLEEENGNTNLARNWYVTSFNFSESSVMKLFYFAVMEQNLWAIEGYFYYILQYGENAKNMYEFAKYYFWRNDFEKIREIQNKLLNESQILYLTKEILGNLECMLGDENSRECIKFLENARILEKQGDLANAEAFYRKSAKYNENGYFSLINFLSDNSDLEKYGQLEEIFETASLEEVRAKAAYELGVYEESHGNVELAVKWYETSFSKGDYKAACRLAKLRKKYRVAKTDSGIESIDYFKYLKNSADLGYALAMIETALDSHLDSLESFEMAEKILTQNNIFELTQVIANEAKKIYFGEKIQEIFEINYEESSTGIIKTLFENEKKRKNGEIGRKEYSLVKNNSRNRLEIIEGERKPDRKRENTYKKSSGFFDKIIKFFKK